MAYLKTFSAWAKERMRKVRVFHTCSECFSQGEHHRGPMLSGVQQALC